MIQRERRRISLERHYRTTPAEIWELWTTAGGIESWWGPDGFEVRVRRIDLRPGGTLEYTMSAVGPDQIEFLKKAGMKLTTEHQATFTEVSPEHRLAYRHPADFIPGVETYEVDTLVELEPTADGVRLVLTFDAMHDDHWTRLATMGWESQLGRLAQLLDK